MRVTVRDMLDVGRLRYEYAEVGLPWLSARPPVVNPGGDVSRERGPPPHLNSVRFPVSLDAAVTAEVSRLPGKPRGQGEEEVLVVEGIEADGAGFVKFDVYVNAVDHEKVGPCGREMAGSFVSLKHPGKVVVQTTMRVALNEILEDLGAEGDDSITVTLVPVEGSQDRRPEDSVQWRSEITVQHTRGARVTLTAPENSKTVNLPITWARYRQFRLYIK